MKKILKTSSENRKCEYIDCNRSLSIYNHGHFCRQHQDQIENGQKREVRHYHIL